LSEQPLWAKRARVESSGQGTNLPATAQAPGTSLEEGFGHQRERSAEVPCERRLRVPQQGVGAAQQVSPQQLKEQLCFLEQQLRQFQEKPSLAYGPVDTGPNQERAEQAHPLPGKAGDRPAKDSPCRAPLWRSALEEPGLAEGEHGDGTGGLPLAARVLARALKHQLAEVTSHVVDSVLKTAWPKAAGHLLQQHRSLLVPGARRERCAAGKRGRPLAKPPPGRAPASFGSPQAEALSEAPQKRPGPHAGSLSSKVARKPPQAPSTGQRGLWGSGSRESPSALDRDSLELLDLHWGTLQLRSSVLRQQQQRPLPLSLEGLVLLPAGRDDHGEPRAAMDGLSLTLRQMQEALTPGHLKKAKLMFFFTRYPSSTLLKTYFLDVQFSRCITSQLIKWFSNFREFYYIQVEKFARQALLEGAVDAGTLQVSRDSELFHALNTHYNKGNDFEVPGQFLEVASLTLREFFSAVRAGKDSDPSWKKPIYKIISKLDSDIPEGFKATSCSQEL
ncbi:PROX2 protein, partial [Rhinopomastus cyanomelas]|nr:PROX2 protein [Rhinopomastus cyanomelas]